MIKLKNILLEILNTYSVEAHIFSDSKLSITDILNQMRAIRKITIVSNITPEDYPQKPNIEYTRIKMKFVTRGDAKQDIEQFKNDILISDLKTTDLRIPGVKTIKFNLDTLSRL
tara:strand:+ start:2190 stop:2531 length:342 start_codon:yes stop_codon:yes gene_type:complete